MTLYRNLLARTDRISVIGLGYVGLPLAIAFAKKVDVIGYDIDEKHVRQCHLGIDPTREVGNDAVRQTTATLTTDAALLQEARFHIVAVPTPINSDKTPNLSSVISASSTVGRYLQRGSIVVYESTVYPGVTEDVCIPVLERESGLTCGVDFKVGYSPERINPGDKVHRLESIKKLVSGIDNDSLDTIAKVYELIVEAGVHRCSSIRVAEAAKVVENAQRDINIAFMNELAMVFDRMGIDTGEVMAAMKTKWNALGFYPGLVGGHCIAIDPYYFIYEAEKLGYHSEIIAAGRRVNDGMAGFVTQAIIKHLALAGKMVRGARVAVLGVTFKENCSDIRNTKVVDVIRALNGYGIYPLVVDPRAEASEVKECYDIDLTDFGDLQELDCLVVAVPHDEFRALELPTIVSLFASGTPGVVIDVRGIFGRARVERAGLLYWSL